MWMGEDHAPAETVRCNVRRPAGWTARRFRGIRLITGLERRASVKADQASGEYPRPNFSIVASENPRWRKYVSPTLRPSGVWCSCSRNHWAAYSVTTYRLSRSSASCLAWGESWVSSISIRIFWRYGGWLRDRSMLDLHDEGNHAAALARGEVFPDALGGRYDKRRGLFVVERRKAFVVGSGTFENDEIAHHFLDARFGKYPVYRLAGDHRAKEICGRIFPSIFSVTRYVGRTPASPKGPEARVREVSRGLSEA